MRCWLRSSFTQAKTPNIDASNCAEHHRCPTCVTTTLPASLHAFNMIGVLFVISRCSCEIHFDDGGLICFGEATSTLHQPVGSTWPVVTGPGSVNHLAFHSCHPACCASAQKMAGGREAIAGSRLDCCTGMSLTSVSPEIARVSRLSRNRQYNPRNILVTRSTFC